MKSLSSGKQIDRQLTLGVRGSAEDKALKQSPAYSGSKNPLQQDSNLQDFFFFLFIISANKLFSFKWET